MFNRKMKKKFLRAKSADFQRYFPKIGDKTAKRSPDAVKMVQGYGDNSSAVLQTSGLKIAVAITERQFFSQGHSTSHIGLDPL